PRLQDSPGAGGTAVCSGCMRVSVRRSEMACIRQLARRAIIIGGTRTTVPVAPGARDRTGPQLAGAGRPRPRHMAAPAAATFPGRAMKILAIDIGGTNVKVKSSESEEARRFPSGKELSAKQMVD